MKKLNENMNKQHYVVPLFKFPKNILQRLFPSKMGNACIWPSDNWVEVHLFEEINLKIETYEVDYLYDLKNLSGSRFFIKRKLKNNGIGIDEVASWVDAKYAICKRRIKSFIMPRSEFFGTEKRVYCKEPSEEDYDRWIQWHRDDDFPKTVFLKDIENTIQFEKRDKVWYNTEKIRRYQVVCNNK